MRMIERFIGDAGRRVLLSALMTHKVVNGNSDLAQALADCIALREIAAGEIFIREGDADNSLYLILAGSADVLVKGTTVASRSVNDVVGEMAAVDPGMRRSADVVATSEMVVAHLSEAQLNDLGTRFPEVYKHVAVLMAQKLYERRNHVRPTSSKLRVFLICSAEAIEIGRAVHSAFAHDDFDVIAWYEGVFRATSYTLQTLEAEVDKADFAVAIAHADDIVEYRENDWPTPRDNVIFELGLFMGRLGRERAILLEPRNNKVRLPSDLAGVTTVTYRFDKVNRDRAAQIAPACNELRNYIREKGPRSS